MWLGKVVGGGMREVKGHIVWGELENNTLDTCMKFSINKKINFH